MSGTACLRRALRATSCNGGRPCISTGALRNSTTGLRLSSQPSSSPIKRQYATVTAPTAAMAPVDAPQTLLDAEDGPSSLVEKKNRERLERIVRKHLEHMSDPWKIGQYVEQTLKKDRFDEALLLTQKASGDGDVVVAWNHLIDYQLSKDRITPAIKLFNEMKKRSQLPNVQTFTIIFRGCAKSQHPKLAVAEAMKHYNILLKDPRLQPNSIHLNAVLNVCARAGDLDSMFLAADSINESIRAPTAYTYTTIFNALRHHAMDKSTRDVSEEQQRANVQKVIDRAKSIWTEVIDLWRRGRLIIDEELVCAMGRLLLLSRDRVQKREILDLLKQTMNIPNLAQSSADSDASLVPKNLKDSKDLEGQEDPDMKDIAVSRRSKSTPASTAVYAIPGRNALALVLKIIASAKLTNCGIQYWNLMVSHYGIVPDNDNWLRLFGLLKVARASNFAASIFDILPDTFHSPLAYRIAMETCVRDNVNRMVLDNANRILDSMLARLPAPDLQALRLYLRVALVSHYRMRVKAQNGDAAVAKRQYGAQILASLERLWEPYKQTHYLAFKDSATNEPTKLAADRGRQNGRKIDHLGELYNAKREVISLARHMFSAFNKVQNEQMVPEHETRDLRPRFAKINREIQAFFSNREDLEPRLRPQRLRSFPPPSGEERRAGLGALGDDDDDDDDDPFNKEEDPEVIARRGGDFVWNTAKPVRIMTREERRRKEWEERLRLRTEEQNTSAPEIRHSR